MSSDTTPAPDQRYAAFRHSAFLRFWLARFLATFSTQIVSVAVGWQIYDLTRDPFDLGLVGIIQFLPSLLLVLVTGAVADRFGRRLIMGISTGLEALCALALLMLSWRGLSGPGPVFAVLALFGIARAFLGPAAASLVANLVPKEDFANAVAWNSSSWQIATIVGPVAGGLLYGISSEIAYGMAAALMAAATLLSFSIPKPAQRSSTDKPSLDTLFAGFRYIWGEKVVLGAISLDLFAVLLSGAVALLPVYARDILELGPWGLGLLRAAPGIGAILVAVWLAGHPIRDHAGVVMFGFRRPVRRLHGAVRRFDHPVAVDRRSRASRSRGHDQRLCARNADPALDAGRGSRSRQRRQHGLCRGIQRARRIPRRYDGGADRHGAGGGFRRRRRGRGRGVMGFPVSGAPKNPPSPGPRVSDAQLLAGWPKIVCKNSCSQRFKCMSQISRPPR